MLSGTRSSKTEPVDVNNLLIKSDIKGKPCTFCFPDKCMRQWHFLPRRCQKYQLNMIDIICECTKDCADAVMNQNSVYNGAKQRINNLVSYSIKVYWIISC